SRKLLQHCSSGCALNEKSKPTVRLTSALYGQLAFPTRVGMKAGIFAPVVASEAVEIPNNEAVANGHLTNEFCMAFEFAAKAVHKSEISFFNAEKGDVRIGAD